MNLNLGGERRRERRVTGLEAGADGASADAGGRHVVRFHAHGVLAGLSRNCSHDGARVTLGTSALKAGASRRRGHRAIHADVMLDASGSTDPDAPTAVLEYRQGCPFTRTKVKPQIVCFISHPPIADRMKRVFYLI